MKKSRILVLALTLALLVCAAFAITASAEDDDNVAILSKNVVYSSNVQMMFAVDVTLEEAEDVVVKYYFESDPEAICTATLNSVTNPDMIYTDANGLKHPSFSTIGIPSKEYGNKVYVSAQMKGSSSEEEYVEYSVAEYFYEKLYAQGYVFKTEGADYNRKQLYISYLNCGAYAQQVLINDKYGLNEQLVTDYNYVVITEGVSGAETGFYADAESLTLTYNGEVPANKRFSGWQITKFEGVEALPEYTESVESNYTLTVDGNYIVTPAFVDALPGGNGAYYNGSVGGTKYDFIDATTSSLEDTFKNVNKGAWSTLSVLSDEKYVRYEKTNSEDTTSSIMRSLTFTPADSNDKVTVIEMDMKIGGVDAGTNYFSTITVDNRGARREIYLSCDESGKIQFRASNNDEKVEGYTGLNADQWYNVRIVISADENAKTDESGFAKIYIDNEYVCTTTLFGKGSRTESRLIFSLRPASQIGTYIEFDNVYIGHVEE